MGREGRQLDPISFYNTTHRRIFAVFTRKRWVGYLHPGEKGALKRILTRNAGGVSVQEKPRAILKMAGDVRSSAETHALHVAQLGPEDRALRALVRPRLKETQNGSPTHNLSKGPHAGEQKG